MKNTPSFDNTVPLNNSPDFSVATKLSISQGSTVSESVETPLTPAEALKQAVELNPENELIFIQLDGSAVVQTYAKIGERAKRILGGLRAFDLQPGHPLVLQVDTSQDFAPILWSCIMGGFVPVPVSIASDYSKLNQALSKLHNIWQQLDYPTILSTSKLASQIYAGLQLHGKKNVKIATIEEIETHSSDTRLHQLQPDELALLLPSSGTTGKPKLIEINSCTFIYRFLKNAINQNNDSPAKILLSWFPLESISGILTTMPNGFQKNIYLPVELLIRNPLLWLDTLSHHRVTHAQTTNFILARIFEQLKIHHPRDWDFSSVQKIGIGAEPIVAKTARSFIEILSRYNLNPNVLSPAYGMTECGPIAFSREGFSLTTTSDSDRFVEIGEPTRGHSIRIVDQQGSILKEGQIGRIQVTGSSMTSGYYKAPELTRQLFTEDGWINTGDLGFLQDGKLTVTGREKETIIINARNFSCHEIELVVEEVEGVEPAYTVACAIRQQDSNTDELAIFFHTLITEPSQLAQLTKQIRGKVTQTLGINPNYIIPIEKATIPRTSTGKIQRLQLKQSLEAGEFDAIIKRVNTLIKQESEKTWVAPRDDLELQLTQIWEKVLGKKPISVNDNFFDLGGHSLIAVRLFDQIEKTFGKTLPLATLFQAATIEELANILRQSGCSASWSSLVPIQTGGSKPPLFFLPSGGAVGCNLGFANLASLLGSDQPVYGLQQQGLDKRQTSLYSSIEELAAHYIKEILTIQPNGSYLLAGLCFGGTVAFEIANQLRKQGHKVALVALFDSYAPKSSFNRPLLPYEALFYRITFHLSNFSQLCLKEKLIYVVERVKSRFNQIAYKFSLRRRHSLPPSLQYFHAEELNGQLLRNYLPQVYPEPVTLFRSSRLIGERYCGHDMGWSQLSAGGVEIHKIPGYFGSILSEPQLQILAEKMRSCIDKAQTEISTQSTNSIKTESANRFVTPQDKLEPQQTLKWSPPWQALVAIQPNGVKQPFFGVHTNDGSVLFYRHLIPHLNPEQPFYGLQAPVRDGKQIPFTQIEDTAAHYIKEIQAIQPSGPYLLGGFCIGGVIAFEMAQQLVAQGEQVALLALFDAFAPFPLSLRSRISLHYGYFLRLEPQEKLTYLLTRLVRRIKLLAKTIQKIPAKFYPSLQEFYSSINSQKVNPYIPQVYPGRVTLFRASKQLPITYHLPDLGWEKLAGEGVEVHHIPGAHTDIVLNEPSVSILAEELQACINKAQAELPESETAGSSKQLTTGVKKIVNLPFQPEESVSYSSLVPIQPNGSKPPLFFTNSIGAAKSLATFLGSEQPVYGLSIFGLPKMDDNQLSSLRIEDIAKQFIQDMRKIQPEEPYLIGAYCGDAQIALEMAQQLYAQGQKVTRLFFIDVVVNSDENKIYFYWKNIRQFGFDYIIKKIIKNLNYKRNKIMFEINKINNKSDIKNQHQKLLLAFYKAKKKYILQTYSGQITLFLSREWRLKNSPELANLAAGGLEIQEIPGYHHLLFEEPYVTVLAEKIQTCIDTAQATLSES